MGDKSGGKRPPSARVLLDIVESHRKRLTDGNVSLSELSFNLLSDRTDRLLLARWTNPGERSNYRIPLRRVRDVAQLLHASEHDTDRLMAARLGEIGEADDAAGAVEAVSWALELAERVVSPEQQFLLDLLAEARKGWPPEVNLTCIPQTARDELVKRFRDLLRQVSGVLTADPHTEHFTDEELAVLRAERVAFAEAYRERLAQTKKSASRAKLRGEAPMTKRGQRAQALRQMRKAIKSAQVNARLVAEGGV